MTKPSVTTRLRNFVSPIALVAAGITVLGVVPPDGGMYVMIDVRRSGLSGSDFAQRLLDEERIAVMPGESFGRAAAGHLRVALTVDEAQLRDALSRLAAFAERISEAA